MKKFEPHYRLVRYGQATKVEKASRQQRMCLVLLFWCARVALGREYCKEREGDGGWGMGDGGWGMMGLKNENMENGLWLTWVWHDRKTTQEPSQDCARYGQGQGCREEEEEVRWSVLCCFRGGGEEVEAGCCSVRLLQKGM